jgi:hypothetical protein
VTDNLVVRSKPWVGADSAIYEGLLERGTYLEILDGPVAGSGYWWYRVEVLATADAINPWTMTGWVAAAARNGEPWIGQPAEAGTEAIPEIPVAITDVVAPAHAGGPASFGVQTLAGATCRPWVEYGEGEEMLSEPLELETRTADDGGRAYWSWRVDAPFPAEWAHVWVFCETDVDEYGAGVAEVMVPIETVAPTPTVTPLPLPTPTE